MPSASRDEPRREVRGFRPILAAVAGTLVWAAHFGAVYAATAVACARGLAGRDLLGLPLVPAMVLGATALALAAVAVIAVRAYRRLDSDLSGEDGEDDPQFTVWFTLAIALSSALAIVWETVPVFIVNSCGLR
jgi:hypothetical protein